MTDPIMKAVERAKSRGPDVPPLKLCVDCRWYEHAIQDLGSKYDSCKSPQNIQGEPDLVRGEPLVLWNYCDKARAHDCGTKAKWFEPKPLPTDSTFTDEEHPEAVSA